MCTVPVYIYIYLRTLYKQKEKMYIAGWHYVPIHGWYTEVFVQTRRNGSNEVSIVYVHVYVGSRVRVFYRITVLRVLPPLGVTAREEEGGKIEKKRGKKGRKGGKERQERRGEEEEEG